MMINYYEELKHVLTKHGYALLDIDWIGTRDFTVPVYEFLQTALKTDYNNGYGGVATPMDVVIVMKDGSWFERAEYDGSEWWEYKKPYTKPQVNRHLNAQNFEYHGYDDPKLKVYCNE